MQHKVVSISRQLESIRQMHGTYGHLTRFIVMMAIFMIADAIISYIAPVYIQSTVGNPVIMGMIMSISSIIGLASDILISNLFPHKKYRFFLIVGLLIALVTSLTLVVFPPWVVTFVLVMALWGVYYEMMSFAKFQFLNKSIADEDEGIAWGVMNTVTALAYIVGPFLASVTLKHTIKIPPALAAGLIVVTLLSTFKYKKHRNQVIKSHPLHLNLHTEFSIWLKLAKTLWPVLVFIFSITLVDAAMWTSGAILAETWSANTAEAGLIFAAYLLPFIYMGLFINKVDHPAKRQKLAFAAGLCAGSALLFNYIFPNHLGFLITIFIAANFIAIATPEIFAAIEGYISRLGHTSNSLIGLQNAMTSCAFIIGPLVAGVIAQLKDHQSVFAFFGAILVITSLISLAAAPLTLRLPQKEIKELDAAT